MTNTLRLDHAKKLVIMDKTFAKFAANTRSEEYAHLQQVRRDYPHYEVIQRTIKRNPNKECYVTNFESLLLKEFSSNGMTQPLNAIIGVANFSVNFPLQRKGSQLTATL